MDYIVAQTYDTPDIQGTLFTAIGFESPEQIEALIPKYLVAIYSEFASHPITVEELPNYQLRITPIPEYLEQSEYSIANDDIGYVLYAEDVMVKNIKRFWTLNLPTFDVRNVVQVDISLRPYAKSTQPTIKDFLIRQQATGGREILQRIEYRYQCPLEDILAAISQDAGLVIVFHDNISPIEMLRILQVVGDAGFYYMPFVTSDRTETRMQLMTIHITEKDLVMKPLWSYDHVTTDV